MKSSGYSSSSRAREISTVIGTSGSIFAIACNASALVIPDTSIPSITIPSKNTSLASAVFTSSTFIVLTVPSAIVTSIFGAKTPAKNITTTIVATANTEQTIAMIVFLVGPLSALDTGALSFELEKAFDDFLALAFEVKV